MPCKFEKIFTEDEADGMRWLSNVLDAIVAKGPAHRSYNQAKAAIDAINKMEDHRQELHCVAHAQESRLLMQADAFMKVQDWGAV